MDVYQDTGNETQGRLRNQIHYQETRTNPRSNEGRVRQKTALVQLYKLSVSIGTLNA